MENFKHINLIFLLVIGLFIFFYFFFSSFTNLCLSRNVSILPVFSNLSIKVVYSIPL